VKGKVRKLFVWNEGEPFGVTGSLLAIPLIYLILPNLPVWIFERSFWVYPHGVLNVECLLVGALAAFLPRTVTCLLLAVEMAAAFIYLLCYTYQFSLGTLWASVPSLSVLPWEQTMLAVLALGMTLLLAAGMAYWLPRPAPKARIPLAMVLVLLVALLVGVDTANGRNPAMPRDVSTAIPRLSLSPLAELAKRQIDYGYMVARAASSGARMDSASAHGISFLPHLPAAEEPNVVMIVVESWGLMRDGGLADGLTAGYYSPSILAKYQVSMGTAPFDGLTISGEARSLCHSHLGFGILNITGKDSYQCLPAVFHRHGYRDTAVHGYVGGMFQRKVWYKAIGFDAMWFRSSLSRAALPRCQGAFPGICDGSIAAWIGRTLLAHSATQPQFVYWMTLNSHLPVPSKPDLPPDQTCSDYPALKSSESLCSWYRLELNVQRSVQRLALEQQPRPTVFILVGDHAPPFSNPKLRAQISDSVVPYVILTPHVLTEEEAKASIHRLPSHGQERGGEELRAQASEANAP
jgi:phosphoglycerol transferase MdoB-like AlkP superfamily enzyme